MSRSLLGSQGSLHVGKDPAQMMKRGREDDKWEK